MLSKPLFGIRHYSQIFESQPILNKRVNKKKSEKNMIEIHSTKVKQ